MRRPTPLARLAIECTLSSANLSQASLKAANLTGCALYAVDMDQANLTGATLAQVSYWHVNHSGAIGFTTGNRAPAEG